MSDSVYEDTTLIETRTSNLHTKFQFPPRGTRYRRSVYSSNPEVLSVIFLSDDMITFDDAFTSLPNFPNMVRKSKKEELFARELKYSELENKYYKQKILAKNIENVESKLNSYFSSISDFLLKFEFNDIHISITDTPSLFFKIVDHNDFDIYLEAYLSDNIESSEDLRNLVLMIYKNDNIIYNNIGDLDSTFNALEEIIHLPKEYGIISENQENP